MADEDRSGTDLLHRQLAGLDALELPQNPSRSGIRRTWSAVWPKLAAAAIGLLAWQSLVWAGWKPTYLFPGPFTVFHHLWADRHAVSSGVLTTVRRAVEYYGASLLVGTLIAWAVTRLRLVRDTVVPLAT